MTLYSVPCVSCAWYWHLIKCISFAFTEHLVKMENLVERTPFPLNLILWVEVVEQLVWNSYNFNALCTLCLLDGLVTATLLELLEDKICFIPWGCKVPGQQMALWLLFPTCLTWPFLPCMNSCFIYFSAAQPDRLFFFCPFLCMQHKSFFFFFLLWPGLQLHPPVHALSNVKLLPDPLPFF